MNIAEKLTQIAENVPKVYEAGFEAGKAEGGGSAEYEFEEVSLVELNEQGKIAISGEDIDITKDTETGEEFISGYSGTVTINISGYVKFYGVSSGPYGDISVDGNSININENGLFEYEGIINENISFLIDLSEYKFDSFTIRKDYDKGYADGKQSEYDRFWDKYQENGARTNYQFAFGGNGWTDETFKPKYDIKMNGNASHVFANCKITDLISALSESGVSFDFISATNIQSLFQYSTLLTRVPAIDASALTANLNMVFYGCTALTYIEKFVVSEKTQFKDNTFMNCTALSDITFDGVVGQNGLNLQWSTKLTAASLLSILTALSKDSAVASGKSITFAKASDEIIGADDECLAMFDDATLAGWTIAYI